ncbi:KamA family radical SAM protein [Halobacteriovorax sp. HLS]|uniref:KamA family radical SAM protein n=1 Tax=Halobacteriovorax sp. HLS TaxID=2234000 RepID=UPI000FD7ABFB|nr:KamA family radical SAM protein [Halobacteriovorax sp. HLS]
MLDKSKDLNIQPSWQSEFKSAIRSHEQLEEFFKTSFPKSIYKIFIPLEIAKLIKEKGIHSALGKQFLPSEEENDLSTGLEDPIGDHLNSPTSQLVHRYKNRVLFFPTQVCPIICRYCFRKNELTLQDELFSPDFTKTISYLKSHTEINEIIFSGGDPFILSDEKLSFYIDQFSKIEHIKYIRFHTRVPTTLPSRITPELISLLNKTAKLFNKLIITIHTNHVDEFSSSVENSIKLLKQIDCELLSQSVLLKGVNDSSLELKNLIEKLIELGVRPYYLHHPDQVKGAMNFYLPISKGRRIYSELRNILPGWSIPTYIIDIKDGAGKVSAFNPETFNFSGKLINKDGQLTFHCE